VKSADLTSLLRGWGQLKANDSGWPVFDGKYINYPRFKRSGLPKKKRPEWARGDMGVASRSILEKKMERRP
jgi:hypothetical protein